MWIKITLPSLKPHLTVSSPLKYHALLSKCTETLLDSVWNSVPGLAHMHKPLEY